MRAAGRAEGIDGDLEAAVGGVFEPDGHGEAAGKFAVRLGFGGASTDGGPGDEIVGVLRNNGVKKFGGGRESHAEDVN